MKLITLVFGLAAVALARTGTIYVTDREDKECTKIKIVEVEGETHRILTWNETQGVLKNYLAEKENPGIIDAMLNEGGLKFCDLKESKAFTDFLFKELSRKNPPRRAFDLYAQYAKYSYFGHLLAKRMADTTLFDDNRRLKANIELGKKNGWVE